MKFTMRGKTCSMNENDEKCIHFRRELEWKEGFLRTRYRGETITMDNKQFVPNPVEGRGYTPTPTTCLHGVHRSNSAFPSFNPQKSSCKHSSKPSGYKDACLLYQLKSSLSPPPQKVPVISIPSIYINKVLNTTNDFSE
jgi:hypothetical protein